MSQEKYDVDFYIEKPNFLIDFFIYVKKSKITKYLELAFKDKKEIWDKFLNEDEIVLDFKYYNYMKTAFRKLICLEINEAKKQYNMYIMKHNVSYLSIKKEKTEHGDYTFLMKVTGEYYG